MSGAGRKVVIVPCSGIGKPHGSVAREAAYEVVEDLRPAQADLVALSLLVLGDEEARAAVAAGPVVTIDGCKLACARKVVEGSGARVAREIDVLEASRRRRDLKPRGIAELNEDGARLARLLAEEIAGAVDDLRRESGGEDA